MRVPMTDSAIGDDQAKDGSAGSALDTRKSTHAESLSGGEVPPLEDHVFQTIFLDKDGSEGMWTKGEIDKEKVIAEKWWKQ